MIKIDAGRCSGCVRCEVSCSFFHSRMTGRSLSRVRVVRIEELGLDYPVVCRQCRERYCLGCPQEALSIGSGGEVRVQADLCTGCEACEEACPIGAIELAGGLPLVCDLCGGEPACVRECGLGALAYQSAGSSEQVSTAPFRDAGRGLTPEQKRERFARAETRALRERWLDRQGRRPGGAP
jgi:Fe-S-cluster-containing hydrogenase component 2